MLVFEICRIAPNGILEYENWLFKKAVDFTTEFFMSRALLSLFLATGVSSVPLDMETSQ